MFQDSAEAHRYEHISSEEYLDRMLAHLRGVRHPEDRQPMLKIYDSLSLVIQGYLSEMKVPRIEGLLCIACMTRNSHLLEYFLIFDEYLMQLTGSALLPLQMAILDLEPDVIIWTMLLNNRLFLSFHPDSTYNTLRGSTSPIPIAEETPFEPSLEL